VTPRFIGHVAATGILGISAAQARDYYCSQTRRTWTHPRVAVTPLAAGTMVPPKLPLPLRVRYAGPYSMDLHIPSSFAPTLLKNVLVWEVPRMVLTWVGSAGT